MHLYKSYKLLMKVFVGTSVLFQKAIIPKLRTRSMTLECVVEDEVLEPPQVPSTPGRSTVSCSSRQRIHFKKKQPQAVCLNQPMVEVDEVFLDESTDERQIQPLQVCLNKQTVDSQPQPTEVCLNLVIQPQPNKVCQSQKVPCNNYSMLNRSSDSNPHLEGTSRNNQDQVTTVSQLHTYLYHQESVSSCSEWPTRDEFHSKSCKERRQLFGESRQMFTDDHRVVRRIDKETEKVNNIYSRFISGLYQRNPAHLYKRLSLLPSLGHFLFFLT